MISSSKSSLSVDFVTIQGDSVNAMAFNIGSSDGKISTYARLAEDLLERFFVFAIKT
jgi:hypothetical protein